MLLKRSAECLDILREITYIFYVGIEVFSRFADTHVKSTKKESEFQVAP